MRRMTFVTRSDVKCMTDRKTSDDVIIFLSGPTSVKTPLSLLRTKDVIAVNGAADYLIKNGVQPFIYVLTDARFLKNRRDDFYRFRENSRFTFINQEVYQGASEEEREYLREHCFILKGFYHREKGGFFKKIKFKVLSRIHKSLLIDVPVSKRQRLVGFSQDISLGYCSCHTVAYAAMQIAYSLKYNKIICSGLDLQGACGRFYDEGNNPMPSELSADLLKIIPFFKFMTDNVTDINVYNLSDDTAVNYDIIPYISAADAMLQRAEISSEQYDIKSISEAVLRTGEKSFNIY
ncbi:3-deoxy-D-manno-oct-2-ulosonate III transferase WaaZ [Shimwellia blattae]|uniref:Lipopolysaccharide core biosynthesis protein n=1 Tax=Shimwellia blattae (strain ATCC 29907 / DSM 4481 / JCM 1650 / NBRC 105725 / CDC 9005-74) TaxID=630626 RepID=I2BEH3_SHIBC|nr:3-deoxy-D-manno-oct-2-ulosonate III transferase WaaZ [Shimwellia blattae]AFJ48927.1 lipopolysaccharide core biosynthesis protein [Shimwellia blattae DSM 4481 = NBRC 105725]GAB81801.1 lipopolysaccharide core biosynthesis protein RfaZ [Shimwellia blattae DSM 4481 = NBRC 105725]VDY66412.1 lipopolysaccharide core biosynthesis protein [Shimwellia blattae]VEC28146.1 lipopolysaccharide core biosynthesis protein [Shimwellia blattae]